MYVVGTAWRKYWYATKAANHGWSGIYKPGAEARTIMRDLKRIVEWLSNVREVGTKGELGDDMREVHD